MPKPASQVCSLADDSVEANKIRHCEELPMLLWVCTRLTQRHQLSRMPGGRRGTG